MVTKENAKDYLPLIQAMTEGKTIQFTRDKDSDDWRDCNHGINFTLDASHYRVKAEPTIMYLVFTKNGNYYCSFSEENTAKIHAKAIEGTCKKFVEEL